VCKVLGSCAVVKKLTETAQVEIRDLDELVNIEEIADATKLVLEGPSLSCEWVKTLRALKDGQQVATLILPAAKANVGKHEEHPNWMGYLQPKHVACGAPSTLLAETNSLQVFVRAKAADTWLYSYNWLLACS